MNNKKLIDKINKNIKQTANRTMSNKKCSKLSYKITKKLSKDDKKENGIYFTPTSTIQHNLELIKPYMKHIESVLEPSCGSCEFIQELDNIYSDLEITGIELNKKVYELIEHLSDDNIEIINDDFLTYDDTMKYDLIIGNPPYFVMKKNVVDKKYHKYFSGRPNIFILFIIKSLHMLNNKGILSFVLPKSFVNCLYYNNTRQYINQKFQIIDIVECNDDYIETKQETIILIIRNNTKYTKLKNIQHNAKYVLNVNDYVIFGTEKNIKQINSLYKDSKTLSDLNFTVNVGNVVWNQCKKILTSDNSKTRLIYSSDIEDNELTIKKYSNDAKKNYIKKEGINTPLLIINRGYGVGNYNFHYCLIKGGFEYLIENHLICIKYKDSITNKKLIKLYKNIIKSLNDERTKKFIKLYFGNNAINTTEINYILPIYEI